MKLDTKAELRREVAVARKALTEIRDLAHNDPRTDEEHTEGHPDKTLLRILHRSRGALNEMEDAD